MQPSFPGSGKFTCSEWGLGLLLKVDFLQEQHKLEVGFDMVVTGYPEAVCLGELRDTGWVAFHATARYLHPSSS